MKYKLSFLLVTILTIIACQQKSSQQQNKETSDTTETPVDVKDQIKDLGMEISAHLQKVLAANLKSAIEDSGVTYALQFCNVRAYPLTDSIAALYNARIKRVSHKVRNLENKATDEDMAVINDYQSLLAKAEPVEPIVKEHKDDYTYYAPIKISSPLCLKCHGVPEKDIAPEDFIAINLIYPEDEATGFKMNDLRGIWRIDFSKGTLVQ